MFSKKIISETRVLKKKCAMSIIKKRLLPPHVKRGKLRGRRMVIVIALIAVAIIIPAIILFTDFDGDGLVNVTEFRLGTSAFSSDTDGDGLNDGLEVNTYRTKPLVADTDGDGLSDGTEVNTHGTNPLIVDTDNDQLDDGLEVNTYKTYPLVADTDNDGLSDGAEVYIHKTDATAADTDNDGIKDGLEVNGWSITVDNLIKHVTSNPLSTDSDEDNLSDWGEYHIYHTHPLGMDTDNDNLNDWLEVNTYGTDPLLTDTDHDGLKDGEEIHWYFTSPTNSDTDNDGLKDGWEVRGYDANGDNIVDVDLPTFGADPLVPDIFVEVDWMPGCRLGDAITNTIVGKFQEHGIALHIDYGEMGGGAITDENIDILYMNYTEGAMNDYSDFFEKYFAQDRRGTFHWALMVNRLDGGQYGGFAVGADFTVAVIGGSNIRLEDRIIGGLFMHELGHTLGLTSDKFDGIDSFKYSIDEYRSVMNGSIPDILDYSNGPPFNDWVNLNLAEYLAASSA